VFACCQLHVVKNNNEVSFTAHLRSAISKTAINWQFAWVTFLEACEGNVES